MTIDFFSNCKKCILEPFVLDQLEIIDNLLPYMNKCYSSIGYRRLKELLCAPLCNIMIINDRLNTLDILINNIDLYNSIDSLMNK